MTDIEMRQLVEQWRAQVEKQLSDMKVRQWCIDKAIEATGSPAPFSMGQASDASGLIYLADKILEFITLPFADTFRDVVASVDFGTEKSGVINP